MPTLNWIGKEAVVKHHKDVPFRLLEPVTDLSCGPADSGNLIVQGDNLHALKALLPRYAGQVKCIYIDPPYNTGNEGWIYNDNVNAPEIKKWLGQVVGKEAEDLSRHDKWLCMMYPRLALLKEFLRHDGAILISIDDNEFARLHEIIAEIFGEGNIIATLVWEKGKKGDAKFVSVTHEYVLAVAKSKATLLEMGVRWRRRKPGVESVLEFYQKLRDQFGDDHKAIRSRMMSWYRALPKTAPEKAHKHYNWSDDRGLYFAADFAGPDDGRESRPRYDIPHPVTKRPCKKPSTGWRWEEDKTLRALAEIPMRIHFGPDETTIPNRKSYLNEVDQEPMQSVFYKDGRAATLEVESLVGPGVFAFPKDSEVIADLVGLVAGPGDLVLDSFAGSGTTGHAVLKQIARHGAGPRFILIELDPEIAVGVTRKRLCAVFGSQNGGGGESGLPFQPPKPAVGFRYCTLAEPLFDSSGHLCKSVTFSDLARHVFFTETGEPLPNQVKKTSPLIGICKQTAYYLLFNGVLGDKRPDGGNVLTSKVLESLPNHEGPKVIFGEGCRLSPARLARESVTFRQIPYEIKVS